MRFNRRMVLKCRFQDLEVELQNSTGCTMKLDDIEYDQI